MSTHYRSIRKPRKRLNVPFLGNLGGLGGDPNNNDVDNGRQLTSRLSSLMILIFAGSLLVNYLIPKGIPALNDPDDIRQESWQMLKVVKRYTDDSGRNLVEMRGKDGPKRIDLSAEKSQFWNELLPYQYLSKNTGTLEIQVMRYDSARQPQVMFKRTLAFE
jgi:hypothetical protein